MRAASMTLVCVVMSFPTVARAQARPRAPRAALQAPAPAVTWQSVSAGGGFTCAISQDGAAYCWGSNSYGSLGNGDTAESSRPARVSGNYTFRALSAGGAGIACALTGEGQVLCWGQGYPVRRTPQPVAPEVTFRAVGASSHACAVATDGAAYCWGSNGVGQLGNGLRENSQAPQRVAGGLGYEAVALGGGFSCALTAEGAGYCWGGNSDGQLGNGEQRARNVPVAVVGGLRFQSLDAGADHACGVTAEGTAHCWGKGDAGQLGTGTRASSRTPVPVTGGLVVRSLTAGFAHTCGLTDAGAAYCWGVNEDGELGTGTQRPSAAPVAVAGGLVFRALSAGSAHTCGVTSDGAVYCWGNNDDGQVGARPVGRCRFDHGDAGIELRACVLRPTRVLEPRASSTR